MAKYFAFAVVLSVAIGGCKSGGSGGTTEVAELGIEVKLPSGFSYTKKGERHIISKSAFYAATLEKRGAMPANLEKAVKSWMSGKVVDKGEVPGGGFFGVIQTEFPTDGEPMTLPFVYVQVPVGGASILCSGQLQVGDDPAALLEACKGVKALSAAKAETK